MQPRRNEERNREEADAEQSHGAVEPQLKEKLFDTLHMEW